MTAPKAKRPAHRPPKYPGEPMTTLTVRLPVRLKQKVVRLSDGRTGNWVCDRIEKARERELEALLGQRGEPDWHTGRQREDAIAALRERLGEKT